MHHNTWGKGYATELINALILWAFQHLLIQKLIAVVHPENTGSQKVLTKAVMVHAGTINYWNKEVQRFEIMNPEGLSNPHTHKNFLPKSIKKSLMFVM